MTTDKGVSVDFAWLCFVYAEAAEKHGNTRTNKGHRAGLRAVADAAVQAEREGMEAVAYIHRQGNHYEVAERFLNDDEKARGWTEEPLYTHPPQASVSQLNLDYLREMARLEDRIRELEQASATVPEGMVSFHPLYGSEYRAGESGRGVLTYGNQPFDNGTAWRLGEACRSAADSSGGDFIDGGLSLLRELQAKGFGVVRLAAGQQHADKAQI